MTAGIDEGVDLVILVARDEDRLTADVGREIVVLVRNLALVCQIDPIQLPSKMCCISSSKMPGSVKTSRLTRWTPLAASSSTAAPSAFWIVSSADFFRFGWSGPRSSIVAVMAVSLRLLTEHVDIIWSDERGQDVGRLEFMSVVVPVNGDLFPIDVR